MCIGMQEKIVAPSAREKAWLRQSYKSQVLLTPQWVLAVVKYQITAKIMS